MSGEPEDLRDGGPEDEPAGVGDGTLQLDLPAVHAAARMARHLIRPFARSGGVVGTELDNLLLVASELLSNAVDHGGGEAAVHGEEGNGVRMRLALQILRGAWRLEVSDEGGGDAESLRELIQPGGLPDLEDERGRGFFLISQMVDEIHVETSADGRGLSLVATRDPAG